MTRRTGILWAVGLLALCATGCGDTFEEGRAKTLAGGLKILDVKEGTGEPVQEGDRVEVLYVGWLKESRKQFDSNKEPGRALLSIELGKAEVIPPGFEMGLDGMKSGGTRRIFIPARLGYGSRGAGRDIPPDADLVFEVEIVKVSARRPEVKKTDLKEGSGPAIKRGDRISVLYTGWLTNGTKFDSSADHGGKPFELTVGAGEVIKGWDQGLIGAREGGKRRLEIPAKLAYGSQDKGSIPPNSDLVFEIEILSVVTPAVP